ncbi:MAG: radical SAM protein [Elusimicrobia bacterium]|nr:radical SAM protein [Elusimicrobiota bacterium]
MPDIPFWNKCDNRCVMCANLPAFARAPSGRYRLKAQIKRFESYLSGFSGAYAKNADNSAALNLTGGEPTLHPDFLKLLAYFRKRTPGRELSLLSNGRRFAHAPFAGAALKAAGAPFSVAVSLHGSTAAGHDAVTGVRGSFEAALTGLRNIFSLKSPGQTVEIRLVLHRRNIKDLEKMLLFLLDEFSGFKAWRAVALHYELDGRALRNRSLTLRLAASAAAVNSAARLIRGFREFRLYHFPLCLLRKELRPLAWVTLPPEDRSYAGGCGRCVLRADCVGLMASYNARFGPGELKPLYKSR